MAPRGFFHGRGGAHLDESAIIESAIAWACAQCGDTSWSGRSGSFVEDALETAGCFKGFDFDECGLMRPCQVPRPRGDDLRQGVPERGSLVFYDCRSEGDEASDDGPVSWGHCGLSLGRGSVVHALDAVRIDDYRAIERLTSTTGDHPTYLGWADVACVLAHTPRPVATDASPREATSPCLPAPVLREIAADEAPRLRACLEALADHHNRVSVHFRGCYPKAPFDETIARFRRELADGSSHIAVAEANGTVVGFCKVDLKGSLGSLDYLVVLAEHRGRGLGDALMGWALARSEAAGVDDVEVKVADGNDATSFYERYGFRPNAHILRMGRGSGGHDGRGA